MIDMYSRNKVIKEIEKLEERYDIQQKKIDDAGYSEEDLGNLLNKMVEQYPVLDRLWAREQLWSRIRGLEEVILISNKEDRRPGLTVGAH